MTRYDRRIRLFAACLSAMAGFVDALGFIKLGGLFVSFMSGNSTRLAVGIAQNASQAPVAAGLIGTFVLGVMAGSVVGRFAREHRRPAVLTVISALLAFAAILNAIGITAAAIFAMTLAMGAENAIFERDGEVTIGLTYMTGALVKFGQGLTGAMLGGDPLAWAPYLMLWVGLVLGATAGALTFPWLGLSGLWIAAAAAGTLAFVAARTGPDRVVDPPAGG